MKLTLALCAVGALAANPTLVFNAEGSRCTIRSDGGLLKSDCDLTAHGSSLLSIQKEVNDLYAWKDLVVTELKSLRQAVTRLGIKDVAHDAEHDRLDGRLDNIQLTPGPKGEQGWVAGSSLLEYRVRSMASLSRRRWPTWVVAAVAECLPQYKPKS